MEEENFFYYLTHATSTAAVTRWDDDSTIDSKNKDEEIDQVNDNNDNTSTTIVDGVIITPLPIIHSRSTNYTSATNSNANSNNNITTPKEDNDEEEEENDIVSTDKTFLLPPMGTFNLNGGENVLRPSLHGLNGSLHGSLHINVSSHGVVASSGGGSVSSARSGPSLARHDSFGFKPLSRRSSSFFEPLSRRASSFVEPFNDHTGKAKSVVAGLFKLMVLGAFIGIIMPKNEKLPTPWYRITSSIVGYSYFIFWCASFYPQVVMNFQRKSTEGLSIDYTVINFLGYVCYTSYTSAFYWDKNVQDMYRERHYQEDPTAPPAEITVESNDVAFAIHALIMSIIWLFQLEIYGGFKKCRQLGKPIVSRPIFTVIVLIVISCTLYGGLIILYTYIGNNINSSSASTSNIENNYENPTYIYNLSIVKYFSSYLNWLDYLYFLSYMKVLITIAKYIPQVIMNMKRKSCVGWNIWNILLDITGGILSLVQLVGDAYDLNDLSSIVGNAAKLGLSGVSIFFDMIFLLQHYVWYPTHDDRDDTSKSVTAKRNYEVIV
mmetsp:Transcript_3464/g.4602  ORF Transcript_3464/g.4602 Transcript_3464/m.4602 type:complete len:548 (+) Transcript_3464:515-2158(+)